ncbi:hypothetical protein Hanom_Chr14g01268551 [Helianthus anomalus]
MAKPEEVIYNLFDSFWFQHHILTHNSISKIQDHKNHADSKEKEKQHENVELITAILKFLREVCRSEIKIAAVS